MTGHDNDPASLDRSRRGMPSDSAQPSDRSSVHPRAVLLDFHNTTAVVGSFETWIEEARSRMASPHESKPIPIERIRDVWTDAKKLFPTLEWDLDPAAHRHAFVSTLSHDGAVSLEFAGALYETMPNQWVLNDGASYEVGYVKPDPRIFQLAANALDTDPSDCLMIGDSAHDDVGGAALGMPCVISRPDQMWRAFALACPR
jgi:hypothetical protein